MSAQQHPTGNVTFLFTDIEGSTARWESHREAMQLALRQHDEILRGSIEAHDGYVFKTIGDAFCAAFARPLDAALAALDAQRALAAGDFTEVGGLRVRMAIHAGETDERGGDYFGPPVNRVARLLNAGHGGQVLLSGPVSDAIGSQLADGVALRSLGTLPLRDLKEPERVHELVAPGLAAVTKGLRSLQTPANNLPRVASAFFGRHDDTMRVVEMVRHNPLVTVVGAGGIGKTRLALEVASAMLNESSDGAWFVDLAPMADSALVAGTILAALGAPVSGGASPVEQLVAYASKRSLLLVIDNCEQVVAEVAAIASSLVARCPETAVLATSREALGIAGERVYHLATLDLAASIDLFADRASAANPRFVLDEAGRAAVSDICKRLDGIALGIELAAARARSMPVAELAKRLELRMLSRGSRDASARQQTMSALVGWSYDLLGDDEKALFRHISVFAGGMTLDSVNAVCASDDLDEWSLLDLLSSLTEKSLLVPEPPEAPARYRMLEPLREYAREKLHEAGETHDALARHARGFADIADRAYEEWDTNPAPDWLERQERELDNYRAALRWSVDEGNDPEIGARIAGSAGPVFLRLSLLLEGVRWGELAAHSSASLAPAVQARVHYSLSMLQNNLTAFGVALYHAERASKLYRIAGQDRGLARALSQLAQQTLYQGELSAALRVSEDALSLARRLDDPSLLASVLARCANAASDMQIETSRAQYRESVALFREMRREADAARVMQWWAGAEALRGDMSIAAQIIDEALPLASGELELWVTSAGASIYWAMGERDRAALLTRRALDLASRVAHPILLPSLVSYVALVAAERDLEEAARLLGYADERQRVSGHVPTETERGTFDSLRSELRCRVDDDRVKELFAEGAKWSDEQASARAGRF